MTETTRYLVIRDTREQQGWDFPKRDRCLGTDERFLKTGDYSVDGYESVFVVERKRNTSELAQNIIDDRFERELQRMEEFRFGFVVCEFNLEDIVRYPRNSGIPSSKWKDLRITPQFMMKRVHELQLRYKAHWQFVGQYGREYCSSLFKRILEVQCPTN